MSKKTIFTGLLLIFVAGLLTAQTTTTTTTPTTTPTNVAPDPRVTHHLQNMGLTLGQEFNVAPTGEFRLVFPVTEGGRTQLIFINSQTNNFRGQEVREVWSIANIYRGNVPEAAANQVLRDSFTRVLGGWYVVYSQSDNRSVLAFCVKLPADSDLNTLANAILLVTRTTDALENTLTNGRDDY